MAEAEAGPLLVGEADETSGYALPGVSDVYKEPQFQLIAGWLTNVDSAIAKARAAGVDEPRISQRITQLLHARELAAITFLMIPDDEFDTVTESWIGARMRDMLEYDPTRADVQSVTRATVDALMYRTGEQSPVDRVFSALSQVHAVNPVKVFSRLAPMPFEEGLPTVILGDRSVSDKSRSISIHGYDRSAAGLRRIMRDMQTKREQEWIPGAGQNDELIRCISWLFAKPENVEKLLGESMDTLQEKGLKWKGSITLSDPHSLDPRHLRPVVTPGGAVGAAVYGIPLRDSFVTQFLVEGRYPPVGAFTMPRSTFQNLKTEAQPVAS